MVKSLIISLSFGGLGIVAWLTTLNVRHAIKGKGWERRINAAYAIARVGFIITIGLVTEAIFHLGALPWTWRLSLYTFGLTCTALGYLGIAIEQREKRRP